MSYMEINHKNYTVKIEEPIISVDNEARGRSGHMTHALAEFGQGEVIAFNSNCSAKRHSGHFPYGWVEYRISKDSAKTFSDFKTLDYSYECFLDGVKTISVEKAVACPDGTIVAFLLRNDAYKTEFCAPWATPMFMRSTDGGKSWSEPEVYSPYEGRTYDAIYYNNAIYVLHFCNPDFEGTTDEHKYRIYKSTDSGKTFSEFCVPPVETNDRCYATLVFDDENRLHFYAYNIKSEQYIDHAVSEDEGATWKVLEPCYLEKGIRNPQSAFVDGVYFLHGRTADRHGFVIYTSENGIDWDEGCLIENQNYLAGAYYSNNIVLNDEKGKFLLVQYSSPYTHDENPYYIATVNVKHMVLRVEK